MLDTNDIIFSSTEVNYSLSDLLLLVAKVRNAIQGFLNVIPSTRKPKKRQHKEDTKEETTCLQHSSAGKKS